jgi:hypothetical protein
VGVKWISAAFATEMSFGGVESIVLAEERLFHYQMASHDHEIFLPQGFPKEIRPFFRFVDNSTGFVALWLKVVLTPVPKWCAIDNERSTVKTTS